MIQSIRASFQRRIFLLCLLSALLPIACSSPSITEENTFAPATEQSYCSTASTYSSGVTVTSTAQFRYRLVTVGGLGAALTANIRHAEVQILNSSGSIVQCGTTSSTGTISMTVPNGAGTYTLKVLSRADNSYMKASVLDAPSTNTPYSISQSFSVGASDTSVSVTLPNAEYQGTLEGGAFNILDQVFKSNEYLRNNTNSASWCSGVCTVFTVAPKVAIYWKPGFNPGSYLNQASIGKSFYLNTDAPSLSMLKGIYILGGLYNDFNCQDTDHYDNSVIIHEYGHYIEDAYSVVDSPGGNHNGNSIIDPRLAWGEGWGNFFQSAVLGNSVYRDTVRNSACTSGTALLANIDLETQGTDIPAASPNGEGVFREISVSRMLWETIDNNTSGDGVNAGFSPVWEVLTDTTSGFANTSMRFRNVGKFNELMTALLATHDNTKSAGFSTLLSDEKQLANQSEYAEIRTAQSSSGCTKSITGASDVSAPGGGTTSDLLRSNDFFAYYFDGSNNAALTLRYAANSGTPSDLDLYIYPYDHNLGSGYVTSSARAYPEPTTGVESVSLAGQAAGYYLVNVKVNSSRINNQADYYIEFSSGVRLCP